MSKKCCKCKQVKDDSAFYVDSGQANGLDNYCSVCRIAHNCERMYVNGQYIPKSHPLYRAGRYKSFEDAAFSGLVNYKRDPRGHVYIITNEAWRGWVKVGKAVDANDRLNSYQTSSPMRDYELYAAFNVRDRAQAEKLAHVTLDKRFERRNEWFKCDPDVAATLLEEVL
jgi:hypothetical protein